jgi:hydrogenase-4 component F
VAITGAPPFGLFLSELTLMRAGMASANVWAVMVLLVLLIVIFIGFLNHFRAMYFEAKREGPAVAGERREPLSAWMTLPMWLAFVPVLVLGVWWPQALWRFFEVVAADLGGGTR